MMPRPVYVALAVALVAFPAVADTDPTNYDECILETMKGVSSDVAARAIIESCRSLFPDTPDEEPASAAAPGAAAASGAAAAAATSQATPTAEAAAPVAAPEAASAREPAAPASQPSPAQQSAMPAVVAAVPPSVEPTPGSTGSGIVRELTREELGKLESRGYFFGTSYRVKVQNGNDNLRLTELTIAVWDKNYIDGLETYRSDIDIPPLGEGNAKYTVVYDGEEDTWAWKVVGAKGAE